MSNFVVKMLAAFNIDRYRFVMKWYVISLFRTQWRALLMIIILDFLSIVCSFVSVIVVVKYISLSLTSGDFLSTNWFFSKFSYAYLNILIAFLVFFLSIAGGLSYFLARKKSLETGIQYTAQLYESLLFSSKLSSLINDNSSGRKKILENLAKFTVGKGQHLYVVTRLLASSMIAIVLLPTLLLYTLLNQPVLMLVAITFLLAVLPFVAWQSKKGVRAKANLPNSRAAITEQRINELLAQTSSNSGEKSKFEKSLEPLYKYKKDIINQRLVIESGSAISKTSAALFIFILILFLMAQLQAGKITIEFAIVMFFVLRLIFAQASQVTKMLIAINRFFPSIRMYCSVMNSMSCDNTELATSLELKSLNQMFAVRDNIVEDNDEN